jgi:hypothetical protein
MGWIRTESGEDRLTVGRYFDDTTWVEHWEFGAAPNAEQNPAFVVPRFDRMLSFYLNNLIESGLVLRRIHEPRVTEQAVVAHRAFAKWRAHVRYSSTFARPRRSASSKLPTSSHTGFRARLG